MKILLVDDNILNLKVVKYYLDKGNYPVDTLTNGNDVLQRVSEENYSLILLDIILPGMNGYEITEKIRNYELNNNRKPVPIIAITGNFYNIDRKKCLEIGMNEILAKPFSYENLMKVIDKYIITNE